MKFSFTRMILAVMLLITLIWATAAYCDSPEPRLLKDINATASGASSNPFGFVSAGEFTYFIATDGINGQELWKSDGTANGTVLVKDIYPGISSSSPVFLTNVSGTLFFTATNGTSGKELWKSDGTEAGTVMVKDIWTGSGNGYPFWLINMNGTLLFTALELTHGQELWKSDGTETGTVLVKDIRPGSGASGPMYFTKVNGTIFFSANDGTNGQELWKTDGTEAGTELVKDIWPGSSGSNPEQLTDVNGTLFFVASEPTNGKKLWKSDGTTVGTMQVKDFYPGTSYPSISSLTNVNGTLFFTADDGIHGIELWKSDGTTAGTVLVKDLYPGIVSSSPSYLTNINGTLFFSCFEPTYGSELWKSDGSEAGTIPVKDTYPGPGGTFPQNLTDVNGTLYFTANNGINDRELWKSDGTADNTLLVKDIFPGTGSSNPANLTNVSGKLFFQAEDQTNGAELWVLDTEMPKLPTATTGFPSSVGSSTATLNGTVDDKGTVTLVSFEFGLDTNYGSSVSAVEVSAGAGATSVSSAISGLTCGTIYHFRVVAQNAAGTAYGSDDYFFTSPCPMVPNVTTEAVAAISTTSATLKGSVYPNWAATTVTFDYGLTTGYGFTATASQSPLDVNGGGDVSAAVSGLSCGTTYHFRVIGQNVAGAASGLDATFTTTACPAPGVSIIKTVAGNGAENFAGDDGPAASASFKYPYGVTTDRAGNVYIADTFNYRIRKLTTGTGIINTVAGTGTYGSSGDGGLATAANISCPYGVAVDSGGNIYIADTYNHLIRKIDVVTGIITTVAGLGYYNNGFSGDGEPAISAKINNPRGLALDRDGNLYIADTNNNRIRKVNASTGIITTVAGNGTGAFAGDGGAATSASLKMPYGVAVDNSGNLFIADSSNLRIRKVDKATGIISTVAGKSATGIITYTGEGGPATSATLPFIGGVTVDGAGNVYVAGYTRILKIDPATGIIKTVAGNGIQDFSGDGGLATTASIQSSGVTIDTGGNLYIADTGSHRLRKVIKAGATSASISYSPVGPYNTGDQVTITANFNDLVSDAPVPQIRLSGSNTLAATTMNKVDFSHYTYTHIVTAGNGRVTVSIPTGIDINGVPFLSTPDSGATFVVKRGKKVKVKIPKGGHD